jgi:hypothetical protein
MADNQIVKIDFQFDLGNVPSSTKAFANYLKGLGVDLKFTKASTDALAASVSHLATAQTKAAAAGAAAGNSIKKSNMSYTNLALVLQDLPYGFRGIQNNLPALVGSFAATTGPIYLGISAVIAAVTAWDMGLFGVKKKTDEAKKSQDSYNESLKTAMSSAFGEISQVKALVSVVENHGLSIDKRRIALKKLQDEYPAYFNNMSVEKTSINQLTSATNSLTSAIIARAEANAMTAEVEKLATQRYENTKSIEKNETAILNMNNALIILSKTEGKHMSQYGTVTTTKSPYDIQLDKIKQLEKANRDLGTKNQIIQNNIAQLQNSINFRMQETILLDYKQEKSSKRKVEKQKVEYFDLTKAVDDYYEAKINFAEGDDVIQRNILKQQQMSYDDMLSNNLISTVKWYDKTSDLYKKIHELTKRINDQQSRDAERFANDRVRNVEAQLDTELKIHRKSIILQKQDIEKAMATVGIMAATSFDSSAIAVFLKKFDELGYKLKALPDAARLFAEEFNNILSQTLVGGFSEVGEQLANVLATGEFKFGGIISILADALIQIGKALILYSSLVQAAKKALESGNLKAAIPIGILAIAAGFALKASLNNKKNTGIQEFANGGIISGPTYGLMGEYPGAKSNPEVVAPLDKLKDMIGSQGGGQFVLKGQDLVLALNRSEKSLTLRRG